MNLLHSAVVSKQTGRSVCAKTDALLIVDVQNDFCTGGALAVPTGEDVVPVINRIAPYFGLVIASKDWHPSDHVSFVSNHAGKRSLESVEIDGRRQTLWPDHCVQGTRGAELHPELHLQPINWIVHKGWRSAVDAYSAFSENDTEASTGLEFLLAGLRIRRLFVCGLATDYCVKSSALMAQQAGFTTIVIGDAIRGVDQPPGSVEHALQEMQDAGIAMIGSDRLS